MLKSVVMAYHFIGPDGPTDTLEKRDPCKVLSLVFKIMKVLLYAIVNMLSVWSVV